MKKGIYILLVLLCACKKDAAVKTASQNGTKSISGKVEKGPYKNGASLVIYELNSSLGQTGKSFSAVISNDLGDFSLNNISLNSNYVLITANGYYYNEHFNKLSEGPLYLESYADISNATTVNINLLTHIIKPRIDALLSQGKDFNTARAQAQTELGQVMGVSTTLSNFESVSLTSDGFLMSMSLLFQRHPEGYQGGFNYTAELSNLLANFRNDFANNGLIDNSRIIDTLKHNAARIDLISSRENLTNYYNSLGITVTLPDFEQYVYAFQKKYFSPIYTTIVYPDSALGMPDFGPSSYVKNIAYLNNQNFPSGLPFTISAIVPFDSSLTLKCTKLGSSGSIGIGGASLFGWDTAMGPDLTLTAQRKNVPLGLMVYLNGHDTMRMDYFKNGASSAYISRTIYW